MLVFNAYISARTSTWGGTPVDFGVSLVASHGYTTFEYSQIFLGMSLNKAAFLNIYSGCIFFVIHHSGSILLQNTCKLGEMFGVKYV